MNKLDEDYKTLLNHILVNGKSKSDRTGTGTLSVFDYTIRHKMEDGFPLLTTKKVSIKNVISELLWFLGNHLNDPKYRNFERTNIKYLLDQKNYIWIGDCHKAFLKINANESLTLEQFSDRIKNDDEFCNKYGNLGPVYGHQWRGREIDQISQMISDLKNNPDSRRILVDCWQLEKISEMTLPPCHYTFQCYTYEMDLNERISEYCKSLNKNVSYGKNLEADFLDKNNFPKRKLSLKFTNRSSDTVLGTPYNLASYGLLLMMLAKETNMIADELIYSGGDVHLYKNHLAQSRLQTCRESYELPTVTFTDKNIFDLKVEDFTLHNYISHPAIKADLSN